MILVATARGEEAATGHECPFLRLDVTGCSWPGRAEGRSRLVAGKLPFAGGLWLEF